MKRVLLSIVIVAIVAMPANAAKRVAPVQWPSDKQLARCVPAAMKDAVLRHWCNIWSRRMP